uniref:Uncharacterized protein n=1 Tax=viral metagenome TaxID=1070528 RepID=A0A6C0C7K9_9ZZZZ
MTHGMTKIVSLTGNPLVDQAPPGTFDDAEENSEKISVVKYVKDDTSADTIPCSERHFKMMCNTTVNGGTRTARNSRLSKSIVDACVSDGIHIANAFGPSGEVWRCFSEALVIRPGDVAHMYYGDLSKSNSKHFVGKVLSSYKKFSETPLENYPNVKKTCSETYKYAIFCRVDWKEVPMTEKDEYMLKNPGKNGFRVQGTILRIR